MAIPSPAEQSWSSARAVAPSGMRPDVGNGDKAVLDRSLDDEDGAGHEALMTVLEDISHHVVNTAAQISAMREEFRWAMTGLAPGPLQRKGSRKLSGGIPPNRAWEDYRAMSPEPPASPTNGHGDYNGSPSSPPPIWREGSLTSISISHRTTRLGTTTGSAAPQVQPEEISSPLPIHPAVTGTGANTSLNTSLKLGANSSERQCGTTTTHRVSVDAYVSQSSAVEDTAEGLLHSKLPPNWPCQLKIHDSYRPYMSLVEGGAFQINYSRPRGSLGSAGSAELMHMAGSSPADTVKGPWFIIHPNSWGRSIYDMLSLAILFYDLTVVPLILAWDVQLTGAWEAASWITVSFWTSDIFISLITGYSHKGVPVLKPADVALHYIRHRLATDLVVVVCEWLSMGFWLLESQGSSSDGNTSGNLRMLRFAKLSRLLRIMTVLRMLKLVHIVEDLIEAYVTESLRVFMKVARIFVLLMWCNHVLACGWWWVGKNAPTDTDIRWVEVEIPTLQDGSTYEEAAVGFQYTSSFHWAAAQITLGAVEMNCVNSLERLFNVTCLLIGLLLGATLISSISATMVDYQMTRKEQTEKKRILRRFLRQNEVQHNLSMRVQQQVADRFEEVARLDHKDVEALKVLSPSLQTELRFAIARPRISHHALLRLWVSLDFGSCQHYIIGAVHMKFFMQKDEIFLGGQDAESAYLLTAGQLSYIQEPRWAPIDSMTITELDASSPTNTWFVEAALWSHWIHVGSIRAESAVEVAQIDGDELAQAISCSGVMQPFALQYCAGYHARLITSKPPAAPWPTDLHVPFTDFGDLVLSMPVDMQQIIGSDAMEQLANGRVWMGRNNFGFTKLRQEVEKGKSIVVVDGQGNIRRVVAVVAIRVERSADKCLLAQVGRLNGAGKPTAACQLPGGKQEVGESPDAAMERIMKAKMAPLIGHIELDRVDRTVEVKPSKDYGVNTKYLRSVYVSNLPDEAEECFLGEWTAISPSNSLACAGHAPTRSLLSATPKKINSEAVIDKWSGLEADLGMRTVFLATEPGKSQKNLYAWLSEQEFQLLQGAAEEVLDRWLEALDLNNAEKSTNTAAAAGGLSKRLEPQGPPPRNCSTSPVDDSARHRAASDGTATSEIEACGQISTVGALSSPRGPPQNGANLDAELPPGSPQNIIFDDGSRQGSRQVSPTTSLTRSGRSGGFAMHEFVA